MKRYVALLRGINVGGKNKISMAELKKGVEALGFSEVRTYLNSGNIIFSSASDDKDVLVNKMKGMVRDCFHLDIPVLIVLQKELEELLRNAPPWWGNDDKEIYDNIIFLIPPLSYEAFYDGVGNPKEAYEKAYHYKDVVFWSFSRKNYQKTNWWAKTAGPNIRDGITIRTANTVRKIAGL